MDGRTIAYIAIKDEGVKAVEAEHRVLEFIVEGIEPVNVTLSLNGVIRRLRY